MAGFLSQSDKIPPDRIKRSVTTKMSSDMKEAADTCLIVSGGPTDREFAAKFVKERKYPYVIAVDAGLAVCEDLGLVPDLTVGDFDTFGLERMEELRKKEGWATDVHKPEKDETDTDLAVRSALRAGFRTAHVLGAMGGRLDHELSNIHLMRAAKDAGLFMEIYDAKNRIFLLTPDDEEHSVFRKTDLYGKYVSFLPLTEKVLGITLDGFKYPLHNKDISILENPSLCVSNEVPGESAKISFREGILICVESGD